MKGPQNQHVELIIQWRRGKPHSKTLQRHSRVESWGSYYHLLTWQPPHVFLQRKPPPLDLWSSCITDFSSLSKWVISSLNVPPYLARELSRRTKVILYFWKPGRLYFFKNIYLFIWLHRVLVAACRIFSCGMWDLSRGTQDLVLWPGIEPRPPALGVRSLNHCTTREVPVVF